MKGTLMGNTPGAVRAALGCIILLAGCTAAPGATIAPTDAAAPAPGASSTVDCIELTAEPGFTLDTIESLSRDASVIALGTFEGYGPATWNTPGGQRPSKADVESKPARLVRPMTLAVSADLRGVSMGHVAIQRGGSIGCDSVEYSGDTDRLVGQRYVYFLVPALDSERAQTDQLLLLAAWPVGSDDSVRTPHDGDLSIDALRAALASGGLPPDATPNEPTTGPQG
jgi:hypothetical protein